jgi:putative SOS response-associated peptidase YedK
LVIAGWGLIPFWLKPQDLGKQPYSTINARAETIRTSPTYREPFKRRRCLVSASGWYEWQKLDAKRKRPIHMRAEATPFAFAGVYDVWKGDGGRAVTSFAIVTTPAASSVMQYHDRMPLALEESQFDDWMRGTPDYAAEMMKPYGGAIEAWEVGAEVGNVKNNRPELMDRVGAALATLRVQPYDTLYLAPTDLQTNRASNTTPATSGLSLNITTVLLARCSASAAPSSLNTRSRRPRFAAP